MIETFDRAYSGFDFMETEDVQQNKKDCCEKCCLV